jgi:hypothetical protein
MTPLAWGSTQSQRINTPPFPRSGAVCFGPHEKAPAIWSGLFASVARRVVWSRGMGRMATLGWTPPDVALGMSKFTACLLLVGALFLSRPALADL